MTMKRVAHVVTAGAGNSGVPGDALSEEVAVDLVESKAFLFPTSALELMVTELAIVEAAVRAAAGACDGVLIGAVPDYGVDAVRAALRIPVVGCGQASLLTAASLGRRFSIVTIWPSSSSFLYRRIIDAAELTDRCASVRHVSQDAELATLSDEDNFYTQMVAGREHMLKRIGDEIDAAIHQDGADVIVLGCNCMTPIYGQLADRTSLPVIDPTRAGYRFLAMLVGLGVSHSRAAYPAAEDRSALLGDMIGAATESLARTGDDADVECAVCAVDESGDSCTVQETSLAGVSTA